MRKRLAAAVALSVVLAVSGCSGGDLEADVLGTWHLAGSESGTLTLESSGAIEFHDLPRDLISIGSLRPDEIDWGDLVSGGGSWALSDVSGLRLTMEATDGQSCNCRLFTSGSGESLVLFHQIGSDDSDVLSYFRAD